jgi:hypothetical protein
VTDLSPAAQAVLNAVTLNRYDVPYYACPKSIDQIKSDVAAALRAAADQVVPWQPEPTEESVGPTVDFGYAWALFSKANDVRQDLHVIADELEAQ